MVGEHDGNDRIVRGKLNNAITTVRAAVTLIFSLPICTETTCDHAVRGNNGRRTRWWEYSRVLGKLINYDGLSEAATLFS